MRIHSLDIGTLRAGDQPMKRLLAPCAIALVAGILYSNTLDSPFVFDDGRNIVQNRLIEVTDLSFGELSEAAFASSVGANSIGNVFPLGMDLAALTAYLTVNDVSRSLGAPVVPFDLVVLGPAVPDPQVGQADRASERLEREE